MKYKPSKTPNQLSWFEVLFSNFDNWVKVDKIKNGYYVLNESPL